MIALNIRKRTRVKNSEILQLLIYSAYIEEYKKLRDIELNTFRDITNYYYKQGQKEVNNTFSKTKKKALLDMTDILFIILMTMPNAKGYIWEDYIQAIVKYNSEQIYRQMTVDLQQQNIPDVKNNAYQTLIKKQGNSKLNINNNTISGEIDLYLIGMNNYAKVEGIKRMDPKAKIKFIATVDEKETIMCRSLNGKVFNIDSENVFDRYYGETPKELKIQRIKCYGLVLGVNLPPISHHFHWCRSTVIYQVPNEVIELEQHKKASIFNSKTEKELINKFNIKKLKTKNIDKLALKNILENMEKVYKDFPQVKGKIKKIKEIEHPYGAMNIQPQKDGTYIIEINKKFFKDEKLIKEVYEKDIKAGFHPKGTYKDMGIHELGHGVLHQIITKVNKNSINAIATDWNNNITSDKILNMAFDKLQVNDIIQKNILINNISQYATKSSSETIAEAFADYYANKDKARLLSRTLVDVMKGMI